jgi:hypothetical protein
VDPFEQLEYQPPKPKGGRPSKYTEELADRIMQYLLDGEGIRFIEQQPGMPSGVTIMRWVRDNEPFRRLYEEVRQLQLDLMAQDILEIADNAGLNVPGARLRTDVRKWLLSKLVRHTYGDTPVAPAAQESDIDFSTWSEEDRDAYIALHEKNAKPGDAAE